MSLRHPTTLEFQSSEYTTTMSTVSLRAVGFCGVDDSIHQNMLIMMSQSYPVAEFGVLFHPMKQGKHPRYASVSWIDHLVQVVKGYNSSGQGMSKRMKLAAHLCGSHVDDVLTGNDGTIIQQLNSAWNIFDRIQINATAVNGVDTTLLHGSAPKLLKIIQKYPRIEFIIQKNVETQPLWQGLLDTGDLPSNVSMLVDESKGTGLLSTSPWPQPPLNHEIGYAGGIGPLNIRQVLEDVQAVAKDRCVWIDMESSLRTTIFVDGDETRDIFDITKCYAVIDACCAAGLVPYPRYLGVSNEK
jgi:hypothetical protein